MRNALLGIRHPLPSTEKGRLFEQWLILQCIYFARARHLPWRFSAYRTEAGAEVDLIIDLGRRLLAVECKLGRSISRSQLGGLRSFVSITKKPVQSIVVFHGERIEQLSDDIQAIPWRKFLLETLVDATR